MNRGVGVTTSNGGGGKEGSGKMVLCFSKLEGKWGKVHRASIGQCPDSYLKSRSARIQLEILDYWSGGVCFLRKSSRGKPLEEGKGGFSRGGEQDCPIIGVHKPLSH